MTFSCCRPRSLCALVFGGTAPGSEPGAPLGAGLSALHPGLSEGKVALSVVFSWLVPSVWRCPFFSRLLVLFLCCLGLTFEPLLTQKASKLLSVCGWLDVDDGN